MYEKEGEQNTLVGFFREENQRVYLYRKDEGKEYLVYDFSLEVGDTFYETRHDLTFTVESTDQMIINGDTLKTLHLSALGGVLTADWVEGVGNPNSPLENFYADTPNSWGYSVAYVLGSMYWPFTFGVNYNGWWGQQPQMVRVGAVDMNSDLGLHYILLPDPEHDCNTLHVYGDTIWNNGLNRYAYCVEDKSTHRLKVQFEELGSSVDGKGRYHIDLFFPFFNSGYTVVDAQGEHTVSVWQGPSDDYRPFIEEGKVWKVGHTGDWPGWFDKACILQYFYFEGDTIVDGRQCKKMMRREEFSHEMSWYSEPVITYVGALYEDNRCVYCSLPDNADFVLLYDFGSPEGTEINYYSTDEQVWTKGYIKERKISEDDMFHGRMATLPYYHTHSKDEQGYLDIPLCNPVWREGVGYCGFYNNWDIEKVGGKTLLMSCTLGDEVLYFDSSIIDGVTPDDGGEVKRNTIDFTHVVKTRPKAPRSLSPDPSPAGEGSEETENLTGEYSLKELFVNFKPLAGQYTITICDESGTEVYRKEVQTNNVIGLNTDISDYPKGEYTLTVENDDEAYTASINIDEVTGIRRPTPDPSRNGGEKAGVMWDLSGRKAGALRPGFYIKDGKKVVVK